MLCNTLASADEELKTSFSFYSNYFLLPQHSLPMTLHRPVCPCLREQRSQRASLTVGRGGHVLGNDYCVTNFGAFGRTICNVTFGAGVTLVRPSVFDGYSKLLSEKTIKKSCTGEGLFFLQFCRR